MNNSEVLDGLVAQYNKVRNHVGRGQTAFREAHLKKAIGQAGLSQLDAQIVKIAFAIKIGRDIETANDCPAINALTQGRGYDTATRYGRLFTEHPIYNQTVQLTGAAPMDTPKRYDVADETAENAIVHDTEQGLQAHLAHLQYLSNPSKENLILASKAICDAVYPAITTDLELAYTRTPRLKPKTEQITK